MGAAADGQSKVQHTVDGVSKKDFAQTEVEPLLRQIRGNELPLDSNPRAPYILFQDYSRKWPVLAQEYKDNLGVICNEFLAELIDHVWPVRMRDPLRYHFLEVKMRDLMEEAEKELGRLTDDMELEVQPYDPEYETRLRTWRAEATQNGGTYTEAEEVLEKMLIYYDLTARIFTRNVITQVVERHLLLGMLRLFNPVEILRMPDSTIENIAAENKETRERRIKLKAQKKSIEEARSLCAGLAMRSDLRSYEDETEDAGSDDENQLKRQPSRPVSQQQQQSHQQPLQQQRQSQESTHRPVQVQEERTRTAPNADVRPRVPVSDAAHQGVNPALGHQQTQSWEPQYHGGSSRDQAPAHAPPPPPRPYKMNMDEADRYYDARGDSGSMRDKLTSAMRRGVPTRS
jgi:hypothetical protein